LIFGKLSDVDVVCMQGRFHSYEGYANSICTLPIKVFKLIGIKVIILTCASGGINRSLKVGDMMMIKDHIGLPLWSLQHPLIGLNDEKFGPRFPAANRLYQKDLRDLFRQTAESLNIEVKEGVYISYGGPSYETVTELRAFGMLGADIVGMSVAQEAIVAGYCGIKLFALALITNMVVLDYDSEIIPNHQEVMEVANKKAKEIEEVVIKFVKNLKDSQDNNLNSV
jgi:purine-nucleoside phosphorylase